MVSADLTHAGISDSEHKVQLRRAVVAATIGTAIEWYDFFLYSTVTGLVFAKLYFVEAIYPPQDGEVAAPDLIRG